MNSEQQSKIVGALRLGCPLETAVAFAGATAHELRQALVSDPQFTRQIDVAEAATEMHHMEVIRQEAKENWRASVWWLEHCLPERYARRTPPAVTPEHLASFIAEMVELVHTHVRNADDADRLVARLTSLGKPNTERDSNGEIS